MCCFEMSVFRYKFNRKQLTEIQYVNLYSLFQSNNLFLVFSVFLVLQVIFIQELPEYQAVLLFLIYRLVSQVR
jgi:hypothetical protein